MLGIQHAFLLNHERVDATIQQESCEYFPQRLPAFKHITTHRNGPLSLHRKWTTIHVAGSLLEKEIWNGTGELEKHSFWI